MADRRVGRGLPMMGSHMSLIVVIQNEIER